MFTPADVHCGARHWHGGPQVAHLSFRDIAEKDYQVAEGGHQLGCGGPFKLESGKGRSA